VVGRVQMQTKCNENRKENENDELWKTKCKTDPKMNQRRMNDDENVNQNDDVEVQTRNCREPWTENATEEPNQNEREPEETYENVRNATQMEWMKWCPNENDVRDKWKQNANENAEN